MNDSDNTIMNLLNLPVVVLEKIFSNFSYDEIAKNRLVSKSVNEICMRLLNRGFHWIERRHSRALKTVKAQLPRRESERRYHPLARHNDILTSLETRISMLNMTYTKFIDNGICCFIPGKVIDEMRRVLKLVETTKSPPRAHEVLQELRDISSMAIEHFDEKISSALRKKLQQGVAKPVPKPSHGGALVPLAIRQEMLQLRKRSALNAKLSMYLATQYKTIYKRVLLYNKIVCRQRKTIRGLLQKQKGQNSAIADLKKRIEECDIKYSEITHTNQSGGGKAIAVTGEAAGGAGAEPGARHFSSQIKLDLSVLPIGTSARAHHKLLPNIKPRKPAIRLPSLTEGDSDPPRKTAKVKPEAENPNPSTSRPRARTAIAKIRDIANEIRSLPRLSVPGKLKRARDLGRRDLGACDQAARDLYDLDGKKQKLD